MKILGIDPGVHGGLAVIDVVDGTSPQLVDAIDLPLTGVKAKERIDALAVAEWIHGHQPQHACVERGQAMPRQGASSGFKYGRAVGSLEAVVSLCKIPVTIIEPSVETTSRATWW